MKLNRGVWIAAAVLFGGAFYAFTQQSPGQSSGTTRSTPPKVRPSGVLFMERTTWNIVDLENLGLDLSAVNTPEKRLARWKSVLAIENPEEYAQRFPPTAQQQAAGRVSALGILQPQTLDQFVKQPRTREDQESLQRARDSILHPVPISTQP